MAITQSAAIERLQSMSNTLGNPIEDSDWNKALNYSLREHRSKFNVPWAERRGQLLAFPNVFQYAAPSDMSHPKPPQKPLNSNSFDDTWFQTTTQRALARHRDSTQNKFALRWERSTKYLMLNYTANANEALLHSCDDFDANGTWSASGDASSPSDDVQTKREDSGSMRFTVTNSSNSAVLTNSGVAAVDLTDYQNRSRVFFWLFVPVSGLTAVRLRVGSGAGDYYETPSITTQFHGAAIETNAWNLFSALWTDFTTTGSPTITGITYLRVALTNAGTSSVYRLDHVIARQWEELEMPYYSQNLVLDKDGVTYKSTLGDADTAADDQIVGSEEWDDLVLLGALKYAARYIIKDADLLTLATSEHRELYRMLQIKFPSEAAKVSTQYFPLNRL